uniref:Transglutaminase N-terminal domain-containing protein n=1 Tax=Acanthochromis polyacanthus TaxID=80966 RepID=A0A3Q1EQE3_9TELE
QNGVRSRENNSAHRTREIDGERLIVRRGQPFSITLQCSDSLPPKHHLELVLHLGEFKPDDAALKRQPLVSTRGCKV